MSSTAARPTDTAESSDLQERIQSSFDRQGLLRHIGARLVRVGPGLCELALPYSERVTQQQGGFHGGVMGALADVAAGYAGLTVAPEGMEVTTVEYKVNFLAAFQHGELRATGQVLKAGKRLIITSAEVLHVHEGRSTVCAVMQQTLMPVPKTY